MNSRLPRLVSLVAPAAQVNVQNMMPLEQLSGGGNRQLHYCRFAAKLLEVLHGGRTKRSVTCLAGTNDLRSCTNNLLQDGCQ